MPIERTPAFSASAAGQSPAVRSVHPTASAQVGNGCLLGLGIWLALKGRYVDGRNSLARRLRNHHVRDLAPVEAAGASGTLRMHAGVCDRVTAKAAAISNERPDKRIAATPDLFSLTH